jgi:low affinity Fe/Cu permease
VVGEAGPELLQAHVLDASARSRSGPPARGDRAYPRVMGPLSTGSPTWDVILEVGIAVCLVLTIVLLIRNYRGRR